MFDLSVKTSHCPHGIQRLDSVPRSLEALHPQLCSSAPSLFRGGPFRRLLSLALLSFFCIFPFLHPLVLFLRVADICASLEASLFDGGMDNRDLIVDFPQTSCNLAGQLTLGQASQLSDESSNIMRNIIMCMWSH